MAAAFTRITALAFLISTEVERSAVQRSVLEKVFGKAINPAESKVLN